MRRIAGMIAILILLVTAAPLLACVTGSAMNQEESACCRAMHGRCGGMETMDCCRTTVRSDEHPQLASSAPVLCLTVERVACWEAFAADARWTSPMLRRIPHEHSPPGLLAAQTTVLRI